jgi:hypothetical protein
MKRLMPASLLALCTLPAFAARPLVADDAGILDPGQCQLESFIFHDRQHTEYWAVPACNFAGGWELAAGVAHTHTDLDRRHPALLQAKTLLRKPDNDGWSLGLVLANQFRPAHGVAGDWTINLPLTVELDGDRLMVHANAGWLHPRGAGGRRNWAVGVEKAVGERAAVTADVYGSPRGPSFVQLGWRYTVLPGRADIDFGVGDRAGLRGKERYYTMGLTLFAGL